MNIHHTQTHLTNLLRITKAIQIIVLFKRQKYPSLTRTNNLGKNSTLHLFLPSDWMISLLQHTAWCWGFNFGNYGCSPLTKIYWYTTDLKNWTSNMPNLNISSNMDANWTWERHNYMLFICLEKIHLDLKVGTHLNKDILYINMVVQILTRHKQCTSNLSRHSDSK